MPNIPNNEFDLGLDITNPELRVCTKDSLHAAMMRPQTKDAIAQIEKTYAEYGDQITDAQKKERKEKVDQLKKQLEYITPQGHSQDGYRKVNKDKSNIVESYWTMMDYDGVADPRSMWEKNLQHLVDDLRIVFAYISPSGHGLKVMFLRPENMTVKMSQYWFAEQTGLTDFDKKTFDPLRAHYLPSIDYVLYLDDMTLFDIAMNNIGYTQTITASLANKLMAEEGTSHTSVKTPVIAAATPAASTATTVATNANNEHLTYCGLELADIRDKYIELHMGGQTPTSGSRNSGTYEIAINMRYVCNFDAKVLDELIPCYDGFSEEEKMATITSALKANRYSMPKDMQDVIMALKAEHTDDPDIIEALDEAEEKDAAYAYDQLEECFAYEDKNGERKVGFPMGIADSFDGLAPSLRMPGLIAIGPMIGGLATGVKLDIHGDMANLNLLAYIVGEAGSGKSKMDALWKAWAWHLIEQDEIYFVQEKVWKDSSAKKRAETKKPVLHYRIQALRTSIADVLDHLNASNGKHMLSYASEGDQSSNSRRSGSFADVGVIIRQSFDGSAFRSSYAGENAINANIEKVLWNITMCTTPDGLRRAITNYTDGELTRQAIGRTPDNTYSQLVITPGRTDKSVANIKRMALLFELMQGELHLSMLEQRCQEYIESVRKSALKDGDKVLARMRMRIPVIAMRYCCCMMLCGYAGYLLEKLDDRRKNKNLPKWADGCETAEKYLRMHPDAVAKDLPRLFQTAPYIQSLDVIADYLIDNVLYYFKSRIEKAYQSDDYTGNQRVRNGANDSVFDRLNEKFSTDDARKERRKTEPNVTDNAIKQMVKNWTHQGLCQNIGHGLYQKL